MIMVLLKGTFIAFVFSRLLPDVRALAASSASSAADIVPRAFIDLVNPIDMEAAPQKLPASMVAYWPTWVLDKDGKMVHIPDSDGFVSPSSIDELWQPIDLQYPEMRLAVGLHVRKGQIRHVMPAVDLTMGNDGDHRNRGMCSVPRAHAWVDFTTSLDEWNQYRLCVASRKNDDDEEWTEMAASTGTQIGNALERAVLCLAQTPPDELGEGSHIVHVLLDDNDTVVVECPTAGTELRVTLEQNFGDTAPGILQVAISAAASGSESEFLPEAYKPLFGDETLRREAYAEYKERLQNNNPNL